MSYLLWGHIAVWVTLLVYSYVLLRKSSNLEKRLETLKGSFGYPKEVRIQEEKTSEKKRVRENA